MKDEYLANKMVALNNETILNRACSFLKMDMPIFCSKTIENNLKELCVIKVCNVLGIKNFNYKSGFLDFFSSVVGEAVADKLSLNMSIACPDLKFVKYDHMNLIREVEHMLDSEDLNEAFIDAFNFLERFKFLAEKIRIFS